MNYDITPVVTAIIGLCAAVITYVVVPWVKRKADAEKLEEVLKWVKLAVAAAEQTYSEFEGKEKKKAVLEYIRSMGYDLDESDLDTAIEAAVNELHNQLYSKE